MLKRLPDPRFITELAKDFWIIRKRPWVKKLLLISLLLMTFVGTSAWYYMYMYTGSLVDSQGKPLNFNKLGESPYRMASYVYAHNGEDIGTFFYDRRDQLRREEIPQGLVDGFIAAEDQRFYSHSGVDFIATGRALFFNFLRKLGINYGPRQGASGITQQEARLLYAEEVLEFKEREPSYWRKVKEAQVAFQLEKRYSKDQILTIFLNTVWCGHGNNGVAEASRYYFGKNIRKENLTPREIAIIASLNKSSVRYCPIFHKPEEPEIASDMTEEQVKLIKEEYEAAQTKEIKRIALARDRYNWVLGRMYEEGSLSEEDYQNNLFENGPLDLELLNITPRDTDDYGYGNRLVKEFLFLQGYEDKEITHSGGLRITTSFDTAIQRIALEELHTKIVEINEGNPANGERIEGAIVIIENKTGRIVALSGGHDFEETEFNRALALRSPGSAAKPFVYGAAMEFNGKTFEDKICNCSFRMKGALPGKWWVPKNFKEKNPVPSGWIPLPIGVIRSVNIPTLNLAREIGIDSVIEFSHHLGVWGDRNVLKDPHGNIWFKRPGAEENDTGLQPNLPTAIGASDVSLLELTSAFSVFARGGTYITPTIITEIKDSENNIRYQADNPKEERVISQETAKNITILLRAVTKIGTAKISMRNIEQQVAVKTGTSNGPFDLLMVGFTPEYTIGTRFGYDIPKAIEIPEYMQRVSGDRNMQVSGGWIAGPMFRKIVDRMYENKPKVEFSSEIEEGLQDLLSNLHGYN